MFTKSKIIYLRQEASSLGKKFGMQEVLKILQRNKWDPMIIWRDDNWCEVKVCK